MKSVKINEVRHKFCKDCKNFKQYIPGHYTDNCVRDVEYKPSLVTGADSPVGIRACDADRRSLSTYSCGKQGRHYARKWWKFWAAK